MKRLFSGFIIIASLFIIASCSKDDGDDDILKINKKNKEAGEQFLAENRSSEGIVERASGLQYKIITRSESDEKPLLSDSVKITYTGRLIDNTVFIDTTETLQVSRLMQGLQEGLSIMREGSSYQFFIPYYLAYNSQSQSIVYNEQSVTIGSYSALIFDVSLIKIIRN